MKPGRQWLVFDADFFDNSFTAALLDRYGPTGIVVFMAFLCACKRNHIQGRISYRNEFEALEKFGLAELGLVDNRGLPFTLDEYFDFTGTYKQTRRTRQGHTWNVFATGWEEWQQSKNRLLAAERKRRSRAENSHKNMGRDSDSENDIEKDSDVRDIRQQKTQRYVTPTAAPVPEWEDEPEPDEPLIDIKAAVGALLRRSTGDDTQNVDG